MVKKWGTVFLALLAIVVLGILGARMLFAGRNGSGEVPAGAEGIRRLHVEGSGLADENGDPVQLTGMSSHGLLWYPEYTNANAMKTLKEYGASVFRVAVYSDDEGGGYVQRKEDSLRLACMAVENALSADMYIIVDWHVLTDGDPLKNLESALEFFGEITSRYGDCPNIIYEICNEPHDVSWSDIRSYAEAVIPAIRSNAPGSVILVGTPQYSYAVESVIEDPLDFGNIMYSFHFYAGQHDEYYNEAFDSCKKNNIPVFVSEWGINYGVNGKPALSKAETFVKVLNRRGISWVAWSLCNKNEIFSAIDPACGKLSGWEKEDLTESGRLFFGAFNH